MPLLRLFLLGCVSWVSSFAALAINPDLLQRQWSAHWIQVADVNPREYGVYHFRRTIELPDSPERFLVHVSADNRYELYVNGRRVSWGPARGDLFHWRFESVDLAPYLSPGRNVLAAVVWVFADDAPMAQFSHQLGFLLQGDTTAERVADTGPSWKAVRNPAYQPFRFAPPRGQYFVTGSGERVDGTQYPWGWAQSDFNDEAWGQAVSAGPASPRGDRDTRSRWMLVPRTVPAMAETPLRLARVRHSTGATPPAGFPERPTPWVIPAGQRVEVLLDQDFLTTAFPEILVSGGRGATVELEYTEALWEKGSRAKGHRDHVDGKEMEGNVDQFISDGGSQRLFRPLHWRTYRYVQMTIVTAAEPLTLEDVRGVATSYPFERTAKFSGGPADLPTILDVGWRSAQLCAHETYMDTPYWEQLQYVGDTRIQALVSLYETGDARLMRNAIEQINATRTPDGLTYSRAPSVHPQYIPPFSLWWIGMVHDYWRYQDDPEFVRAMLPGVRAVLSWFEERQKANGSLGALPWWNYVDWSPNWEHGVPPVGADGSSAPLDLQLLMAFGWAAELEAALGFAPLGEHYASAAARLRATAREIYWDGERRLFADTPEHDAFSEHTNALAVLTGLIEGAEAREMLDRVDADSSLAQATIYFRHYVDLAYRQAGLGGRYLERLQPWRTMLAEGLTTWAETDEETRSDCHAWGASPNIEVFRTVLGIEPAAPGYHRVRVAPQLGDLPRAAGQVPHPRGVIEVELEQRSDGGVVGSVTLPDDVTGEFIWHSRVLSLRGGANRVDLPAGAEASR